MPKKPAKKTQKSSSKKPTLSQTKAKPKTLKAKSVGKPKSQKPPPIKSVSVIPGEVLLGEDDIIALAHRPSIELSVANHGDRPIQVGSHCHFFEVNRALRFDREKAFGFRLKIPSGTAARFEPGEEKHVSLVAFGGNRKAYGINGLTNGSLDDDKVKALALKKAADQGFLGTGVGS